MSPFYFGRQPTREWLGGLPGTLIVPPDSPQRCSTLRNMFSSLFPPLIKNFQMPSRWRCLCNCYIKTTFIHEKDFRTIIRKVSSIFEATAAKGMPLTL